MGLSHSPSIVTNGLYFCLDVANKKSYSGNTINNILDSSLVFSKSEDTTIANNVINIPDTGSWVHNPTTNILSFGSSDFTIDVWFYLDYLPNDNGYRVVFTKQLYEPYVGAYAIAIRFGDSGFGNMLHVGLNMSSFGSIYEAEYDKSYFYDRWANVVMTRESGNNRTFIDGSVALTRATFSGNPYVDGYYDNQGTTDITDLSIGSEYVYPYGGLIGKIGQVKFYNRCLSEAEVKQNYNAIRRRFGI